MSEAQRTRDIEIADVRRIMNKREGRRFMWRLLRMSEPLVVPPPCGEAEANFANGRRVIGTTMWREIMLSCPEQFVLMQQEGAQDEVEHQARLRAEAEANVGSSSNQHDGD